MKKWKLLLLTIVLAGCAKQQTIEDYNIAKEYCESNNMEVKKLIWITSRGESKEVYGFNCQDKEGNVYPAKTVK
jgi:hypothetical protein